MYNTNDIIHSKGLQEQSSIENYNYITFIFIDVVLIGMGLFVNMHFNINV